MASLSSEVTTGRHLARKTAKPSGHSVRSRRARTKAVPYLFLLPWFAGLILLTLGPLIGSLGLSFTNFNLLNAPKFIGLSNYRTMFTDDPRFLQALKVTFIYVVLTVPLQLALALGVALLLNRYIRGLGWYRSAFYLPSLFAGSVAVAVVWRQLFDTNGVVNKLLSLVGIHGAGWISNPRYSLYTIILLHLWQFGSPMVIFLAGIKQVPAELLEAAGVDGAGTVRRFFSITLPLITPVLFFNVVLQTIQAFQAFTPAFIVSNGTGGPSDSTLFYTLYLYQEGFTFFKMGYASAMAWVLLLIIAVFTAANFFFAKFWVFYPDERSGGRSRG